EDYELLFTIRPTDYPKIQQDEHISVIGHVTDAASGLQLIYQSGTMIPIKAQGWDAFGGQES
ncbi:MAG: thiamine-phosphate kinase, partial [Bacteroidota bacterium]